MFDSTGNLRYRKGEHKVCGEKVYILAKLSKKAREHALREQLKELENKR